MPEAHHACTSQHDASAGLTNGRTDAGSEVVGTSGVYRVGSGVAQQSMASRNFRSSSRRCSGCRSRQCEYALDSRIPAAARFAFAVRFKELLGQTPLQYVPDAEGDAATPAALRSVRRSSELFELALVNILNVVIKTEATPEWRRHLKSDLSKLAFVDRLAWTALAKGKSATKAAREPVP